MISVFGLSGNVYGMLRECEIIFCLVEVLRKILVKKNQNNSKMACDFIVACNHVCHRNSFKNNKMFKLLTSHIGNKRVLVNK